MDGRAQLLLVLLGLALAVVLFRPALRIDRRKLTGFEVPLVVVVVVGVGIVAFLLVQDEPPLPLLSAVPVAAAALFGFFFNALVAERNALRHRRQRLQEEKGARLREIADIRTAIEAEIENETAEYPYIDWDDWRARVEADFAKAPDFRPVVPLRVRDSVFRAVIHRIELLNSAQIQAVIRYYTLASDLRELVGLMRSDSYAALDADRRKAILLNFIQLEERLRVVGFDALATFATTEDGAAAALATAEAASKRFGARYGLPVRKDGKTDPDRSDPDGGV